jgi:hypothetical protein
MHSPCGLRKVAAGAGLALLAIASLAQLAGAQGPAETRTLENSRFRFAVALPTGCRHVEGPGTVDAVCSADFDPERSAVAGKASALVLSVAAETVADGAGKTGSELQQRYGEAGFREELAETVCGESDRARVKIANVKEAIEDASVVYTADVVCAPVRFLQIGERRASVRHVITPHAHYRLVARARTDNFDKQRETIDAFFASFHVLPAERQASPAENEGPPAGK